MRNGRTPKSPAFQFYPGDFLADPKVGAMTTETQGAYLRLLCYAWIDGSIPTDHEILAPMCGLSSESFARSWPTLKRCWIASSEGRLVNPRMERERQFQADGRQRRLDASKAANEAKRRQDEADAESSRHRIGAESEPNRSPVDPLTLSPTPVARTPTPETRDPKPELQQKPRAPRTGPHAELIRFWEAEWLKSRLTPYAVEAKDGVAAAAILKLASGDLQEAQRRATALLGSSDAWMVQNASLGLLRSRWNQLAFQVVGSKNEPKGAQGIRDYMARHHGGSNERSA